MLAAAVRDRLLSEVEDLGGRVIPALDFAAMLARRQLPQVTPAAAVLPLGMRGGAVTATFGRFRQLVARRVAVVLVLRAPEPASARGTADLEALAEAVFAALAGWTPDDTTPGVVRLETGDLRSLEGGTLLYDLQFILDDTVDTP
jgi:hypothetical protein